MCETDCCVDATRGFTPLLALPHKAFHVEAAYLLLQAVMDLTPGQIQDVLHLRQMYHLQKARLARQQAQLEQQLAGASQHDLNVPPVHPQQQVSQVRWPTFDDDDWCQMQ